MHDGRCFFHLFSTFLLPLLNDGRNAETKSQDGFLQAIQPLLHQAVPFPLSFLGVICFIYISLWLPHIVYLCITAACVVCPPDEKATHKDKRRCSHSLYFLILPLFFFFFFAARFFFPTFLACWHVDPKCLSVDYNQCVHALFEDGAVFNLAPPLTWLNHKNQCQLLWRCSRPVVCLYTQSMWLSRI